MSLRNDVKRKISDLVKACTPTDWGCHFVEPDCVRQLERRKRHNALVRKDSGIGTATEIGGLAYRCFVSGSGAWEFQSGRLPDETGSLINSQRVSKNPLTSRAYTAGVDPCRQARQSKSSG